MTRNEVSVQSHKREFKDRMFFLKHRKNRDREWRFAFCNMPFAFPIGAVAQLVERLLCKQNVVGSIPSGSTI